MPKYNIQRYTASLVLAYQTNATTIVSSPIALNGILKGIIPIAPDLDSTNTYTFTIKDADGYTIYSKASLAKNQASPQFVDANNQPLTLPLSGNHTITIVTSGSQTANRTFNYVLLIDR